jgi:hypothetical protein
MHDDIDELIRDTAPWPGAGATDALEATVWRRVAERHRRAVVARLQAGILVLSILIGAIGGGVYSPASRTQASELRVLTVAAGLEPFSLASDLG